MPPFLSRTVSFKTAPPLQEKLKPAARPTFPLGWPSAMKNDVAIFERRHCFAAPKTDPDSIGFAGTRWPARPAGAGGSGVGADTLCERVSSIMQYFLLNSSPNSKGGVAVARRGNRPIVRLTDFSLPLPHPNRKGFRMIKNRTALIAAAALAVATLGLSGFTLGRRRAKPMAVRIRVHPPRRGSRMPPRKARRQIPKACATCCQRHRKAQPAPVGLATLQNTLPVRQRPYWRQAPGLWQRNTQRSEDRANAKTPDELKKLEDGSGRLQADLKDKAGQETRVDTSKLDERIAKFRKDWKEKYSQDFRAGDEAVVYADITARDVSAGEAMPASAKIRSDVEANAGSSRRKATPLARDQAKHGNKCAGRRRC